MKFSLPGFRKSASQEDAADKGGKAQPGPFAVDPAPASKPVSLSRTRLKILGAAVVLMLLLALFVFQIMSLYISRAMDQEVRMTVDQVAAQTGSLVKFYSSNMSLLAKDPPLSR